MEIVLIVAKTHMQTGACIGGLTYSGKKSVRLLTERGLHYPEDTQFEVGQIWEMELRPKTSPVPPHIEDTYVCGERLIGQLASVREMLLQLVQPWRGGPEVLFDGLLVMGKRAAYIGRKRELPACSTGYWLPDRPLTLVYQHGKPYYRIDDDFGRIRRFSQGALHIHYGGFGMPVMHIRAQTLVRVSLSRWWVGPDTDEERCYLQLSGWYR